MKAGKKKRPDTAAPQDGGSWGCDAAGNPLDPRHPWNWDNPPPVPDPFRRKLLDLETAFRFRGVKLAALEAMLLCQKHREPWPAWLYEAAVEFSLALFTEGLPKSPGRTGNEIAEYREYLKRYVRWAMVDEIRSYQLSEIKEYRRRLKEFANDPEAIARLRRYPPPDFGTNWTGCFRAASEQLRGTFAQGSPETIKASYELMKSTRHPRFPNLDECARHLGVESL